MIYSETQKNALMQSCNIRKLLINKRLQELFPELPTDLSIYIVAENYFRNMDIEN